MMTHTTLAQLRSLKLDGFAAALEEQLAQPAASALAFEERLALLIDRELLWRNDRKLARLLQRARLKYPQAAIEDLDTRAGRGIDHRQITSLVLSDWIATGHTVLVGGPTGVGKPGSPAHWRNTPAAAVIPSPTCACPGSPRSCASCMAAAASANGSCKWPKPI